MYCLSRLMLNLACVLMIYSAAGAALIAFLIHPGMVALLGGIALFYCLKRPRRMILTACGSAMWATRELLQHAGMLNAKKGFILGYTEPEKKEPFKGMKALRNKRLSNKEACEAFLGKNSGSLVRLPPSTCHVSVYAPTGSGKGVSCITPWLLTNEDQAVIVDFSGELTLLCAEFREHVLHHQVVILDPFHQVTL